MVLRTIKNYRHRLGQTLTRVREWIAHRPSPLQPPNSLDLARLEDRILLSAAPLPVDAVDATTDDAAADWDDLDQTSLAIEADDSSGVEPDKQIVFVDSSSADYEQLVDDLSQASGNNVDIYVIENTSDGVVQIGEQLAKYENVSAVHLISHGDQEGILLGNTRLTLEQMADHQEAIRSWSDSLSDDADLLLYGCNLGSSQSGQQLVQSLANLCGCDVAASDNATGHEALGADWVLEYSVGEVGATAPFSDELQEQWTNQLASITVTTTQDNPIDGDVSSVAALALDPGPDGFITLREAIVAANADSNADVITLGAGVFSIMIAGADENLGMTGDFDVTGKLTIVGAGGSTSIQGAGMDRVFDFHNDTSIIQNLTIGDGSAGDGGNVRIHAAANVTLDDVTVDMGSSSNEGAGIHNSGTLVLSDSLISNNAGSSSTDGGGIFNAAAGTLIVERTTIVGNNAGQGAGLFNVGDVVLTDVTVRDHSSVIIADGGGIYSGGDLFLDRVTINGNGANRGAGIFNTGELTATNATISQNVASTSGGGIYTDQMVQLVNTTIKGNNAGTSFGGEGGGLFGMGSNGVFELRNTILDDNRVDGSSLENVKVIAPVISSGFNIDSDGTAGLMGIGDQSGSLAAPLTVGLGGLDDNGGLVETHATLSGSLAINAGGGDAPAVDATGAGRNAIPDVGAFESQSAAGKIYFVDRVDGDLIRVNPDGSAKQILLTGLSSPRGTAVDVADGRVYYTESDGSRVSRADLDGQNAEVLISTIGQPTGIDLDLVSSTKRIYIANDDSATDEIYRAHLDGSNVELIVDDAGVRPTDIVVDPGAGKLYWADEGTVGGVGDVFEANLDGSGNSELFANQFGPTGIAYDEDNNHLYWTDRSDSFFGFDSRLRRGNTSGSGATNLPSSGSSISGDDPYGIALDLVSGMMFWSDEDSGEIRSASLSGSSSSAILTGQPGGRDLEFVTIDPLPANSPPTFTAFSATVETVLEDTEVKITFAELDGPANAIDTDGSVVAYVVQAVTSGTLKLGTTSGSATPFSSGLNDTIGGTTNAYWTPAENVNGTQNSFTVVAQDDDGATSSPSVQAQVSVTAVNDAPTIQKLNGDELSYHEGDSDRVIEEGNDALVSDVDSPDFDGGRLVVSIATGGVPDEDILSVRNQGDGDEQIGFTMNVVTYDGDVIGMASSSGAGSELVIDFMQDAATPTAASALIRNITYKNASENNPTESDRTVEFTISDDDGLASLIHSATVSVQASNDPPNITSPTVVTAAENQSSVMVVSARDPDSSSITFSIVGGDDSARFAIHPTTGELSFVTSPDFENPTDADEDGVYRVEVKASDGSADDKKAISVTVSDVNDDPVAQDDAVALDQNTSLSISVQSVLSNDTDQDGDDLTVTVQTSPASGTLILNPDGTFTYTPNNNFSGSDSFTYVVADGEGGEDTGTVNITVNEATPPPAAPGPAPGPPVEESEAEEEEEVEDAESGDSEGAVDQSPIRNQPANRGAEQQAAEPGGLLLEDADRVTRSQRTPPIVFSQPVVLVRSVQIRTASDTTSQTRNAATSVTTDTEVDLSYVSEQGYLWNQIDEISDDLSAVTEFQEFVVAGTATVTTSLTVGYVVWLLRGGQLLTSLLAQMPAWKFMQLDALAILDEAASDDDEDDESVESLVENARDHEDERVPSDERQAQD